jgi:hypothetical protein
LEQLETRRVVWRSARGPDFDLGLKQPTLSIEAVIGTLMGLVGLLQIGWKVNQ